MKEEQTKPRASRRKEIIKIRAEICEIETKKTTAQINETKSWFFERINKIDKLYPDSRKTGRGLKSVKLEVTDSTEIPMIINDYYEQLYANIMDNLEAMDKFLER